MNEHPPSDESMDRLLSQYFQNELPQPWPDANAIVPVTPASETKPYTGLRSRVTLAASVLILIGLGLMLPTSPRNVNEPASVGPLMQGATANGAKLLDKIVPVSTQP